MEDMNEDSDLVVEKKQPINGFFDEPGGLRNNTRMMIQTRQAQKLVTGRKRTREASAIIGLMDFGRRMKLLWLSAEADDPYADWYLLQIENSIKEARILINEKKSWLDDVLNTMDGIEVEIAQSLKPINISIYFQNPMGYMGAYLVKDYDSLACSVFTARHIGLVDRATAESIIHITGKAIRRTFTLVSLWKFTGVTREDLKQNNQSSVRALETFGECPEDVVSKKARARAAPAIRERQFRQGVRISYQSSEEDKSTGASSMNETKKREAVAVALHDVDEDNS